jgi:hypothetical protein
VRMMARSIELQVLCAGVALLKAGQEFHWRVICTLK